MADKKLNLLVAYPYLKRDIIELIKQNQSKIRFVMDSGAFTAWKAGKVIKLDDYCRFIESLSFEPWRYFALDVVGDPAATMKNYEEMLRRGFKPVPIFTRGEEPSVLDDLYKTSEVVGLGGLVGTEGNKGFVKGIMQKVAGRKVHLLGFTNMAFIKFYKPYMCDASSWEMGARYASVTVYLGAGRTTLIRKPTIRNDLKKTGVCEAIRRLGFNPQDLLKDENWAGSYSVSRRLGANSWVKMSYDIGRVLETKLFLAATTEYAVRLLLEGTERL